jgi:hypothetical protein
MKHNISITMDQKLFQELETYAEEKKEAPSSNT